MTENLQNGFAAMNLPPVLVKNLAQMGISAPKPIQAKTIMPFLQGRDILAIAQTGSGKTFAFSLPILAKIISLGTKRQPKTAAALILAPTRELAVQIEEAVRLASKNMHLRAGLVLGGVSRLRQIKQMAAGVDVLIATPGRLMDHVREGNIDLSHTRFFVLDEADRMLDMGFIRDVRAIAARLAKRRQTALFSATMPKEVSGLADSLLVSPLKVETAPQGTIVAEIRETVYAVAQKDKKEVLTRLLAQEAFRSIIVFTRTKHGADTVGRVLAKAGCPVEVIHGNKSQNARQRALDSFRRGETRVLVATDIAARGLDVPGITHVVNYEFPVEAETYVHRIGRTGRNGAAGEAVTLYDAALEASRLRAVEKVTAKKLPLDPLPVLAAAVFPNSEKPVTAGATVEMGRKAADKTGVAGKKKRFRTEFGRAKAAKAVAAEAAMTDRQGADRRRRYFASGREKPGRREGNVTARPGWRPGAGKMFVEPGRIEPGREEAASPEQKAGKQRKSAPGSRVLSRHKRRAEAMASAGAEQKARRWSRRK
ncbi:DEAD/DEAH box helicase [Candidatus Tokpelaia sp.]|uniref:DEAD/DEAH box helicase n=1 Tax=Candidatus Tokpelaia sp. TaxID=2233777 RepID=UPI00123A7C4D|nr:DEAD/DEAH box helicase [Candidatus Tokpelaia sp.]KAA6405977.1 ATP-dependent helicase [Candidatus Tokpelaia sp.]